MKKLPLFLFLFSLFLILSISLSSKEINFDTFTQVIIDGFEKEGNWKVNFSKYRSPSPNPSIKQYEPDDKWISWIKVDPNKPSLSRKLLLPLSVVRSQFLLNEQSILYVKANWDYKGTNWVSLSPSNRRLSRYDASLKRDILNEDIYKYNNLDYKNYILLPGRVSYIRCYFWGMGYNYIPQIQIQDFTGNLFIIKGRKLDFRGWQLISFKLPKHLKQTHRLIPRVRPARFIRFKIVTAPEEESKGFYTYLDYLHAKTDIFDPPFVGDALEKEKLDKTIKENK